MLNGVRDGFLHDAKHAKLKVIISLRKNAFRLRRDFDLDRFICRPYAFGM